MTYLLNSIYRLMTALRSAFMSLYQRLMLMAAGSSSFTAIGGLIIFFGWLTSNTFKDQYVSIKATVETGRQQDELHHELYAITRNLRRLEERLKNSPASNSSAYNDRDQRMTALKTSFDSCEQTFQYVREQDLLGTLQMRLVKAYPGTPKVGSQIQTIHEQVRKICSDLMVSRDKAFGAVFAVQSPFSQQAVSNSEAAMAEFQQLCGTMNVKMQDLERQRIIAANDLQLEYKTKLSAAKSWSSMSGYFALLCYLVGSVAVISNQLRSEKPQPPEVRRTKG